MFLRKKNTCPQLMNPANPCSSGDYHQPEIILLGDRWDLRYPLSYRNARGNDAGVWGLSGRSCNSSIQMGSGLCAKTRKRIRPHLLDKLLVAS